MLATSVFQVIRSNPVLTSQYLLLYLLLVPTIGNAASLAAEARAANLTSIAYTRRPDGTYRIPTDALGIAPMMNQGVGVINGTVFWNQIYMSQVI